MSQQISPELPVRLRRVRDSGALLFMLAFLGFLGYIIWDGLYMKSADIDLVVHGHDSFGNICGRNNKPIKFSSKSGKNYTDRPYTKYTLVNSKFEPYTSRMRFGELVYVKEQTRVDVYDEGGEAYRLAQGAKEHRIGARAAEEARSLSSLNKPDAMASTNDGGILSLPEKRQQQQETTSSPNGTAPNRMMLPMRTSKRGAPNEIQRSTTMALATGAKISSSNWRNGMGSRSSASGSSYDGAPSLSSSSLTSSDGDNIRAAHRPRSSAKAGAERQVQLNRLRRSAAPIQTEGAPPQMPFDIVELARTNRSLFNALRSNMMYQYPPMYGYSSSSQPPLTLAQTNNPVGYSRLAERDGLVVTMSSPLANRSVVLFAGQTSPANPRSNPFRVNNTTANDSDHYYDHVFVTPRSVIMTNGGRGGDGGLISLHEVPNHLLYLTECVSSCPNEHVELIFYRCMPNNWRFSLFPNAINVTRSFIDDILTDVSHCYRELVYTFSLSLVLSLALLILLRFLASMIVWSCIVLLILIFIAMASYAWLTFYHQIMDLEQVMPHDSVYAEKLASSDKWLIGSIFLTFSAFAIIGTVLFMRKRILLVTTLFKESGKAIADMPLLLLQPLLTFAVLVAIMAAWIMGFICLQSMKLPVVDTQTGFVVYRTETLYKIMRWYHIFSFLWVSHFAIACQHYVIGASVSKWYFSPNRYQLGSPIGTSISELILYYMGTVALGSFLLAIFKVIRVITRQIQFLVQRSCMSPPLNSNQALGGSNYMNSSSSSSSSPSSSTCGSLGYVWRLFIWFFDNIVMIINRDAYVEVAIHGHSFLGGARRAFFVLASNPLRLLAIKSVGNLLLVIAKICVVVGTVSMAYVLLEGKNQQLNYSWSPIVISAVFAYIVAHWFLSVYEMVIDALFICYCEDFEQKNLELNRSINGSNFRAQILNNGRIY